MLEVVVDMCVTSEVGPKLSADFGLKCQQLMWTVNCLFQLGEQENRVSEDCRARTTLCRRQFVPPPHLQTSTVVTSRADLAVS